jgi:osmoprotectant transport system ATP-binding protein
VTRAALADDVRRLHEQLSLTTVMVTHDVAEAVLLADGSW